MTLTLKSAKAGAHPIRLRHNLNMAQIRDDRRFVTLIKKKIAFFCTQTGKMTKTKRKHKGNKGADIPYSKKPKEEKAVAIPVQSNDNCFSGSNNERSERNSNQTR